MRDDALDNAGVVAPPPLMFFGPLVAGILLNRAVPLGIPLPRTLRRVLGWLLVAKAVATQAWFLLTMRRAGTPFDPRKPVKQLVTGGPFRFSRNPSYTAFAAQYVGIALLRNSLWPLLWLPGVLLAVQRAAIEREERYLERKFGDEYLAYKSRVRRWV